MSRAGIRPLFLLRFAPRYRGQPDDAMNRNAVAAAEREQRQKGSPPKKESPALRPGSKCFHHAGNVVAKRRQQRDGAATYA